MNPELTASEELLRSWILTAGIFIGYFSTRAKEEIFSWNW